MQEPFYVAIVQHASGAYIRETDATTTLAEMVDDVLSGELEDVISIIRVSPVYGQSQDMTKIVAGLVGHKLFLEEDVPFDGLRAFLDRFNVSYPVDEVVRRSRAGLANEHSTLNRAQQL